MKQSNEILKTYWGYDSFRPDQEKIINAVLAGKDVLALLPTGGGKSICFQLPTLMKEGTCLVISPLIALMRDQVNNLRKRGIKAEAIYAGMGIKEIDITLDNCIYGQVKFLYVSPERLKTSIFEERLLKMNICLVAVDEAHCISQWGYDFRPSYLDIADIRSSLPLVNFLALTASATSDVKQDIIDRLDLNEPVVFKQSFSRENLSYSVFKAEDKERKMLEILKGVSGSAIVYVGSRKSAKAIANFLVQSGISSDYYHAGLTGEERAAKQDRWVNNKFKVIVATNAFGMGIDKPDVRVVVHYDIPGDLESYYQEAGRAGRDDKKAYAVLLFYEQDLSLLQKRFNNSSPDVATLKNTYQNLANYFKLAIGSGYLASFSFDITQFCTTYDIDPLTAFYSIKKLENEGLIQLNEGFYNPPKVYVIHNKQDLYAFQIAYERFDGVLKALLRIYGGELFTGFCSINENKLTTYLGLSLNQVQGLLKELHHLKVIIYCPQMDSPQITFLTPRLKAENLPVDEAKMIRKRKTDQARIDAMVKYASHKNQCRTQQIVDYFGEDSYDQCGICDWCVASRSSQNDSNMAEIQESIMTRLSDQPCHPDELILALSGFDEKQVVGVVRHMLDLNQLKYLDTGQLAVV